MENQKHIQTPATPLSPSSEPRKDDARAQRSGLALRRNLLRRKKADAKTPR